MVCAFSRTFEIICQGIETSKRQIIKFGARLADDEWHRLGISVKGNSITAIVDCKKQQNREIARYDFSHGLRTPNEGTNQRYLKNGAVLKNLGLGLNFRPCGERYFLSGRPQFVIFPIFN